MIGRRILALAILAACLSVVMVKCEKYRLEYGKSGSLDCSSLAGDVEFYERESSKNDFRLIEEQVKDPNKTTTATATNQPEAEPRVKIDREKKMLKFSILNKEDLDKAYMCKTSDKNLTFNSHPQFIPVNNFKWNQTILSSSFRLVLSLQAKNANCSWRVQHVHQNNTELNIDKNSNDYTISNHRTNNESDVWINDLHVNKPDAEDTGVYVCVLKNEHGETIRMIDVKVKDELLALWPFLIILAQVLLCSGLFFVWEKRCAGRENSNEYAFEHINSKKQRQNPTA